MVDRVRVPRRQTFIEGKDRPLSGDFPRRLERSAPPLMPNIAFRCRDGRGQKIRLS
jgi:hypothetical protein